MRRFLLFFSLLVVCSCNEDIVSNNDLRHLNGYWEIKEVTFPDGSKKNYTVNPNVDFIQLEGNQGFRKKMRPKFDGTFQITNDSEPFELIQIDDGFILSYDNNLSEWEEKLVQLDSISFIVKNEDGVLYAYQRYQPITIPK